MHTPGLVLCVCIIYVCMYVLVCVGDGVAPLTGAAFLAVLRMPLLGVSPRSSSLQEVKSGGPVAWEGSQRSSLCLSVSPLLLAVCPEARVGLVLGCVVRIACSTVLCGRGREATFTGKETD